MKRVRTVFFAVLIGLVSLAIIAAAVPVLADNAQDKTPAQTVTGKITAVEPTSFTISVGAAPSTELLASQANEKSMTFGIDKNTTIEGRLQIGSTAEVTYREANGKLLAISVRIAP